MSLVAILPPIDSRIYESSSGKEQDVKSGTSYTLNGNSRKYVLPSPTRLKPYQDTKSGKIDAWPAHATGQGVGETSMYLTKEKQLVVIDKEAVGQSHGPRKPKFLNQLERFLEKELQCLGVTEVEPSELRLQAFREVFEYLIEDFKTYKPLLSSIKNEYEMMLAHQRDEIRHLHPLQQMLVAVSEHSEQEVMAIREQEKQEIKDLKTENRRLYERIDELKNEQLSLEEQVNKLSENLQSTYLLYRDECDARKLLISDINELRYQQEEAILTKQTKDSSDGEKDDPVTLRIALKKAREDEALATKHMNEMIANYGDVIPRRDYEQLQNHYLKLEEKIETLKEDFMKLKREHDDLLDIHKQVVQQRDDYFVESETLKRTGTPRPNWNRCIDLIAGGEERWKSISDGKTSDQLFEVLLNEMQGKGSNDDADYFDGLGMDPEVPKYLQHEGKFLNRRLSKRDCALTIHDIWKEKRLHDSQKNNDNHEDMADFMDIYLQQRFSLPQMVAEWAYNLIDACQKFKNDDNIRLFWSVLDHQADEEIYHDRVTSTGQLLNSFIQLDKVRGDSAMLSRDDLNTALKDFFQLKDVESISKLVKAAEKELNIEEEDSLIDYKILFKEDLEGHVGPFLEEIKKQTTQERLQFIQDIESELNEENHINVDGLKRAIQSTDPLINPLYLDAILCWAFGAKSKDSLDTTTRKLETIVNQLKNGNVRRSGYKPS